MNSQKKIIGIDLDDILFDFFGHLCVFINSQKNTTYTKKDMTDFMLEKVLGCERKEALDLIADFYLSEEHENSLPIQGSQEAIKKLDENYLLFIISARPEYLRKRTENWVQKHFGNVFQKVYLGNHYHGNGLKRTKLELCEKIGVCAYIEDFIPNAVQV